MPYRGSDHNCPFQPDLTQTFPSTAVSQESAIRICYLWCDFSQHLQGRSHLQWPGAAQTPASVLNNHRQGLGLAGTLWGSQAQPGMSAEECQDFRCEGTSVKFWFSPGRSTGDSLRCSGLAVIHHTLPGLPCRSAGHRCLCTELFLYRWICTSVHMDTVRASIYYIYTICIIVLHM